VVVMVRLGIAGGVGDKGLGVHTGADGPVVTGPDVTAQLNATGLLKPGLAPRLTSAVARPPGSTPANGVSDDTVRVNCPKAWDTDAAESSSSNEAKMIARTAGLKFTMSR